MIAWVLLWLVSALARGVGGQLAGRSARWAAALLAGAVALTLLGGARPVGAVDAPADCGWPGACGEHRPARPSGPHPSYDPAPDERWLEVDLDAHEVRLRVGERVQTRLPAATGRGDSPWTTTHTGVFRVYRKVWALTYLPDQDVYIRGWVAFDPEWFNGFHSFPLDEQGEVLDDSVGVDVTNGCVRTPAPDVVYSFARIGTAVLVHGGPPRNWDEPPSQPLAPRGPV